MIEGSGASRHHFAMSLVGQTGLVLLPMHVGEIFQQSFQRQGRRPKHEPWHSSARWPERNLGALTSCATMRPVPGARHSERCGWVRGGGRRVKSDYSSAWKAKNARTQSDGAAGPCPFRPSHTFCITSVAYSDTSMALRTQAQTLSKNCVADTGAQNRPLRLHHGQLLLWTASQSRHRCNFMPIVPRHSTRTSTWPGQGRVLASIHSVRYMLSCTVMTATACTCHYGSSHSSCVLAVT